MSGLLGLVVRINAHQSYSTYFVQVEVFSHPTLPRISGHQQGNKGRVSGHRAPPSMLKVQACVAQQTMYTLSWEAMATLGRSMSMVIDAGSRRPTQCLYR